jgi:hypothetical protein
LSLKTEWQSLRLSHACWVVTWLQLPASAAGHSPSKFLPENPVLRRAQSLL